MDRRRTSKNRAIFGSEPRVSVTAPLDSAVFADCWVVGQFDRFDAAVYGTHSMRRTKATMIYRRTRNLRAVQLLLGHTKLESTVRYLGIEVDDTLDIAEQTEV